MWLPLEPEKPHTKVTMSKDSEKVREQWGKEVFKQRAAAAKALRHKHTWHRQRAPRPAGLGSSQQGETR